MSPPPSSFGVDLTRLSEPRFFSSVAGRSLVPGDEWGGCRKHLTLLLGLG
jgi:hypothetical protein